MPKVGLFRILLIACLALMVTGCGGKSPTPSGPNIILITIDALRADHMSCYGYSRRTTPFIDNLAKKAVVFINAYSTSSWTSPSMASIFTGHYPRSHGILHGIAKGPREAITGQELLHPRFLTLAEALKKSGYTTFGVSSNAHMSRGTGFSQGFDYYKTHWFLGSPTPNNTVKKWLKHIRKAKKYFLWIHYFDPHHTYSPRRPWYTTYVSETRAQGKWEEKKMANPEDFLNDLKENADAYNVLVGRYDSEINYCDYHIKELFSLLPRGRNTLTVITADHGEAFLDHGQLLHGHTLYEEEVRVPLIFKFPETQEGKLIKSHHQPVSNRDIFPTIMDFIHPGKKQKIPGKSLIPLIKGEAESVPGYVICELDRQGWWQMIRSLDWKMILRGRDEKKKVDLYNLDTDPRETIDKSKSNLPVFKLLQSKFKEWLKTNPQYAAPKIRIPIDEARENKLRSLGYLD